VAVRILNDALCSLLPPCPYARLSLLGQPNLILLWILGLSLSRRWSLRTAIGGILRQEPGYRENDQKKKRIHLASKTLAMMHEPESLHCCTPLGDENTVLMSWLVLEHFCACYILLRTGEYSFSYPTRQKRAN
jgi:hypothetical protein